jgi:hypothetical protein
MKVHESIDILANAQDVWAHLIDPQRLADWHVKLIEVRRTSRGPAYFGERFGTTYIQSRKKQNRKDSIAEVLRCEPSRLLTLRHYIDEQRRTGHVDETFALEPLGENAGTRVNHAVDFAQAGMPLWVRALMWCITRTGTPSGEGVLAPLKRACESTAARSCPTAMASA